MSKPARHADPRRYPAPQFLAADSSPRLGSGAPRTTKLYDRTKGEITIGEVERIQL